tara:strand:- start:4834 stop:5187 length:354 start_codon:yes stop_codon:yes gene_type:complete
MSNWTDELREKAVELYLEGNPTPDNSMEIVKEVADALGGAFTPNSVRATLTKAKVYITKGAGAKKAADGDKPKSTRVSKDAAHAALVEAIEGAGKEVDMEIISKLTGKAAVYFTSLF